MRNVLLWASQNDWMREKLPQYRFVQRAVSRFMPGEELEAALTEATRLQEGGISTILTLLGENVTKEEAAEVAEHYRHVLDEVHERELEAEISVKLTHLGLDLGEEIAYENLASIVERAAELDNVVWIDMESSAYVDITLALFRRIQNEHSNVGVCLQSYLYRTVDDLADLLPEGPAIRLVKGAYNEPPEIAYPKKSDVDSNFLALAWRLLEPEALERGTRPAFATHDERIIRRIQEEAEERGIDRSRYEFQMLYGIGRKVQQRLAEGGYQIRVLISYGDNWYPWYVRRLAERPANLWFVMKSLFS